jgi:hypothetical protein
VFTATLNADFSVAGARRESALICGNILGKNRIFPTGNCSIREAASHSFAGRFLDDFVRLCLKNALANLRLSLSRSDRV